MRNLSVWFVLVLALSAGCSRAEEPRLAPPADAVAAGVEAVSGPLSFDVSGDRVNGEVRLAMLEAPDETLSRTLLEAELAAGRVRLDPVREGPDRYGRIIARVWRPIDEAGWVSVQARLVSQGAARVLAYPDNDPEEITALLASEAEARAAGAGIWGDPQYGVRDTNPDLLMQDAGGLHLVEGRVMSVAILQSGRTYLNFGSDWRTDFTIRVEAEDVAGFETAGYDLEALEGQRIRVRGIIRRENGPMIRLENPLRLERLDEMAD